MAPSLFYGFINIAYCFSQTQTQNHLLLIVKLTLAAHYTLWSLKIELYFSARACSRPKKNFSEHRKSVLKFL